MLLQSTHQATQKAASFVWSLEQKEDIQQVQAAVKAALTLGSYDPADPTVFEMSEGE